MDRARMASKGAFYFHRTCHKALSLAFVLLFVPSSAWTSPIISNVKLGQQDWFGPSANLVAPDSLWGYLSFDYTPDPSQTFFLNVSASLGGGPFQWTIQNIPLFPALSDGDLGLDFDLGEFGISAGTDVSSLDVIMSLDSEFQTAPSAGLSSSFAVENLTYFSWNDIGDPETTAGFDDPGRPKGNKNTAEPDTKPKDRDIKPLQEDPNQCFPGSMARSLDWLNREYEIGVNKPIDDVYKELRDKVKSPAGKDVVEQATEQIRLKDEYAKATFKDSIRTKVYDPLGFVNAIPGVAETTPKDEALLEWLEREMKTEDVELAYYWKGGAHIVTIVSIYKTKDGKIKVRYRDDENQGNKSAGDSELKEKELYLRDGRFRFGADENSVWYLASESPIPEPATLALTGLGLGLLATRRWLKRPAPLHPEREGNLQKEFRPNR